MSDPTEKSRYGRLGVDVGLFGRWSRLFWGILILAPLTIATLQDFTEGDVSSAFFVQTALYFIAIPAAYTVVYWFLGERLFARANPWINTAILVGPAIVVAWWNFFFYPITGFRLPGPLQLAMGLYIGISFILQWKIGYGGCEVVSIPIILFKRRYATYCVPLVALDAAEKAIVDRSAG